MLCATSLPCRSACWAVIGVTWPGRVRSGTAAASPHAYTSGKPGTPRNSSTVSRPRSVPSPRSATSGSGRTPTHQMSERVGTYSPSLSRTPSAVASLTEVPIRTSIPRLSSTRCAVADIRSSSSGSTRSATSSSIHRGRTSNPGRWAVSRSVNSLPVRGHLGPGVAGADHHERAPGDPLGRVVGGVGQLDLTNHVVVQEDRLRHAPEPVRVLGHAGQGQQLVDAADGEYEPVVAQLPVVALGRGEPDPTAAQVDPVHLADDHPYAGQGAGQRDGDPGRFQYARRDLGQQGQVEEVVGRVDQGDVGPATGQAGQPFRRVVPGETGSDDHDTRCGHSRCRSLAQAGQTSARGPVRTGRRVSITGIDTHHVD